MDKTLKKPNVGIVIGSNRSMRICRTIAEWVLENMQHDEFDVSLIDLAEINLPFLDEPEMPARHRYRNKHTKSWSSLVGKYDAFVLVFPQYNWGYPAVLKNALDFLFDEWSGKPVCIVCYGTHGGTKGASAMKSVTEGLRMINIATNPALYTSDEMFDQCGQFIDINESFACYKASLQAVAAEFASLLALNAADNSVQRTRYPHR